MRKDFVMVINYAKYLAFVLATICVLIFQFTANSFCINLALSLYVVAFGLMCISMCVYAKEVSYLYKEAKKKTIKQNSLETQEGVDNEIKPENKAGEAEQSNLKLELIISIVGSIFFGLFAIFTFIVLVLY